MIISKPIYLRKRTKLERIPYLPKMWIGLWKLHKGVNFFTRIYCLWLSTKVTMKH